MTMLALISPAKRLDFLTPHPDMPESRPRFSAESRELATTAQGLAAHELGALMHISPRLASLNHQRFQDFTGRAKADTTRPAIFGFAGDTYVGLQARSLTTDDLAFAQARLRILSGLYGLLRPLDVIRAHRLEMGSRLANSRGRDLYAFWGNRIAEALDTEAADGRTDSQSPPILINLASQEYFKAARRERLRSRVITPIFKEVRQGYAKTLALWAKRARGAMARFMIENRLEDPLGLKDFDVDGYRFQPSLSGTDDWVFTREHPAGEPVGAKP